MSDQQDLKFVVAAVQAGPVLKDAPHWFDLESTLQKAVTLIEEAGKKGARLIVFPECWMPCFPYWSLDFTDRKNFVDMWAAYLRNSVEVPSRETEALCLAAKKAHTYVAIGINERDSRFQGRMYNSILYISAQGEILGTHRKISNTVQERFFHTPGDGGDNLNTVFKTEIGTLGGSMCGEHSQLGLMYYWIMQGIQIHCSLWPGLPGLETVTDVDTRALCIAAGAFGVLAATFIPEAERPKQFYRNSIFSLPQGLRGGSGIISPQGEYIAGPVYDEEALVCGEIDLADLGRRRYTVNLTGIYSRWDLININVCQDAYEPVLPMPPREKTASSKRDDRMESLETHVHQLEQHIAALSHALNKGSRQ